MSIAERWEKFREIPADDEVFESSHKALTIFPDFTQEVLTWLDELER